MKVFITGGSGQVGSTAADMFLGRGDTVMSLENFSTGRRDNLLDQENLTQVEGSIADWKLVDQLFSDFKPDVVVHTAASYKDPEDWETDALVNAVGGANIAKGCKLHKVGRLIYFQTALCYGTKPLQQPITLDHPIDPVNSSYAISKTAGAHYVQFSAGGRLCFAPPARPASCYAGGPAKVFVEAASGTGNGPYRFSPGKDVAVRELYDAVVKAVKLNAYPDPEVTPLGPDDAASILLDPSRTFADFGDIEFTPLDEIARLSVERWEKEGVVGGYTHLKEARADIETAAKG